MIIKQDTSDKKGKYFIQTAIALWATNNKKKKPLNTVDITLLYISLLEFTVLRQKKKNYIEKNAELRTEHLRLCIIDSVFSHPFLPAFGSPKHFPKASHTSNSLPSGGCYIICRNLSFIATSHRAFRNFLWIHRTPQTTR